MSCEPIKVQTIKLPIFIQIRLCVTEIRYLCIWLEATLTKTY